MAELVEEKWFKILAGLFKKNGARRTEGKFFARLEDKIGIRLADNREKIGIHKLNKNFIQFNYSMDEKRG